MPNAISPIIGVDLNGSNNVRTAAEVTAGNISFRLGTTVIGDDGRKYVYVKAAAAITANTTRVSVAAATGLTTAAAAGAFIGGSVNIAQDGAGWVKSVENYTPAANVTTTIPA